MDWDDLAPLSDEQSQSIIQLQHMIGKLSPIVQDIDKTQIQIREPSELSSLPLNHKLRERYKQIQSSQYKLFECKHDDDDKDDDDDEYKYREKPAPFDYVNYFIQQMSEQRNTRLQLTSKQQESWNYLTENANYLRNALDSIQNLQLVIKKLNDIYSLNVSECQHIDNKCKHLIIQQKELELESSRLRRMVKYFADYNQIRTRIYSPKLIDVLSTEFHNIVIRINECIHFLTNHKEYEESDEYLKNYCILRIKCIQFIKNYVFQRLNKAEKDSKINDGETEVNILEFRAAASLLRPLILLIENEAKKCEEYASLLNELQKFVLNERQNTLKQLVDITISQYSKTSDTPNLIRASCSYVMMICLREYKLFQEFFDLDLTLKKSLLSTMVTSSNKTNKTTKKRRTSTNSIHSTGSTSPTATKYIYSQQEKQDNNNNINIEDDINIISGSKRISSLITDLCQLLYSYLRPFIIQTSSMQILCDVIHILQGEIQEHMQLQRRTNINKQEEEEEEEENEEIDSNIPEFDRTIVRIIEDGQERLVFRTQIHLRDQVQKYEIKEKDLNYYGLLRKIYDDDGDNKENKDESLMSRYSDWSPILEKTLSILSKIYPVLNHSVFEFLAYEAVSCCVSSLVELARKLAHKSSSVHGHLFLIKHLLILREQISPFDVDFSITETTLDFGHMTQYLGNLVSSSSKYSLVEVFQHTIPTVNKHQLNSKKSMESVLKKGCEQFIETQTNLLIGPLIELISKYKQQTAINKLRKQHFEKHEKKIHPLQKLKEEEDDDDNNNNNNNNDDNDNNMNDKEKERLLNELNLTLISCEQNLIIRINELMDLMRLYLQNELTQRILLKPIISNMQSAFIQLRKIVIETGLKNDVKLNICDKISDQLQAIVNKNSR